MHRALRFPGPPCGLFAKEDLVLEKNSNGVTMRDVLGILLGDVVPGQDHTDEELMQGDIGEAFQKSLLQTGNLAPDLLAI